jgi:hypothetical protein
VLEAEILVILATCLKVNFRANWRANLRIYKTMARRNLGKKLQLPMKEFLGKPRGSEKFTILLELIIGSSQTLRQMQWHNFQ